MEVHTIMEERKELMVAPSGGKPTLRSAHFLKPTDSPTPHNHSTPFPLSSNSIFNPGPKPLKVMYPGWKMIRESTQKGWENWVEKLQPLYGETWKKAGIFDAIMGSKSKILRRKNSCKLMMVLAQKWHPDTNTFLFPWGETTVTLEDIMVLGGLPVLGKLRKSDEMLRLEEKLKDEHTNISRKTGPLVRGSLWFNHFNGGCGDDVEHAAFLVLWLTRYIFPNTTEYIAKHMFLIAVNLSRGVSVSLAPSVLASIYKDLSSLRNASENQELSLCSPLGLVQVWVWERFLKLSPIPKPIGLGEPRLSRWNEVEPLCLEATEISEGSDSSGDDFLWRPYVRMLSNWNPWKLYSNEKEKYIVAGSEMDSEATEILVRLWRNSELVGAEGCVEQYLPHRVAMQFGFDQDVPEPVERLNLGNASAESTWCYFNRSFGDAQIYVPARMFEADITKRYQEALKSRALGNQEGMDIDPNQASGNDQLMEVPVEMEIPGDVEDRFGTEKVMIPAHGDDTVKQNCMSGTSKRVRFADQLITVIRPVEMEILGDAGDCLGTEKVAIPAEEEKSITSVELEDDSVNQNCMPGTGSDDDELIRPVEMEILGDAEDRLVMIPVHVEKSKTPVEVGDDAVNQNCMAGSPKRSGGSYGIEEVQDMVTKLEKLWAMIKAKRAAKGI